MVADKSKKPKVGEKIEPEAADQIDSELILSIEKLQEVQDELEKINEEASEKVLEVEQKYNVIRKPVYDKRSDIIKSIPDFWLNAFLSHPDLSDLLNEEDQKIFKHLTALEVEDCKDVKSGYSITFNSWDNSSKLIASHYNAIYSGLFSLFTRQDIKICDRVYIHYKSLYDLVIFNSYLTSLNLSFFFHFHAHPRYDILGSFGSKIYGFPSSFRISVQPLL
ncbi:hypothetical protein OSB04_004066 [Centaurea solstitialis]|uniref:Uncharacterized protein n=1 Tax=Centaurea solstitialis TaxID=347529 RepID=A0AA38WU39_9ASTR|nr:hypothetical protein OSB04_004066 [Centaurea solstitialis]